MAKPSRRRILPRNKKELHRVELLGGAVTASVLALTIVLYIAAQIQPLWMRSQGVAAVVSAVLVQLANQDRIESGQDNLKVNPVLVRAAQEKADDMAAKGYFAHTSPDGVDPWHWFADVGYQFDYAGENLAVDFTDSGAVNSAWMASPTHRENILDPHFTEIGIASAVGTYQGHTAIFVVQEFGAPKSAEAPRTAVAGAPKAPAQTAPARAAPSNERVLGATASPPVATVAAAESAQPPAWGYVLGFPRDALRYAYLMLGAFVIFALAFTTRFEMKKHHLRHATAAGLLIALLGVFAIGADVHLFVQPTISPQAVSI